jgi:hypothetical protein
MTNSSALIAPLIPPEPCPFALPFTRVISAIFVSPKFLMQAHVLLAYIYIKTGDF